MGGMPNLWQLYSWGSGFKALHVEVFHQDLVSSDFTLTTLQLMALGSWTRPKNPGGDGRTQQIWWTCTLW